MGVILHAHTVRGELRIQRNASGEVATTQEFCIVPDIEPLQCIFKDPTYL